MSGVLSSPYLARASTVLLSDDSLLTANQRRNLMKRIRSKFLLCLTVLSLSVLTFTPHIAAQILEVPSNPAQQGESIIDDGLDFAIWDTETVRVHEEFNVLWDSSTPLFDDASISIEIDDPVLGMGTLVYSMDTVDGEQSMLMELVVDVDGLVSFTMVPMNWDRAHAWENLVYGISMTSATKVYFCTTASNMIRGGWGDFWSGYWHYLTHPGDMDDDLETGFYVAGGIGVGAGVVAGGIVAAPVVAGTTFTIPTIGVTTTTTTGLSGGGLVLGGTVTTITTGSVTVSGTTVVAGTAAIGGTTLLMSVDPNKLHHVFDNAGHNLDDFLNGFGGNQETAFEAVKNATQTVIDAAGQTSGLIDDIIVNVGGTNVTVRGVVIDGIVRVGTFFIP